MLTLLVIAMFAKFAHSVHLEFKQSRFPEVQDLILETPFGQEYVRITRHKHKDMFCTANMKSIQNQVSCKPRDRIIPLGNDFIPKVLNVKRCAGACSDGDSFLGGTCHGGCGADERRNVTLVAYRVVSGKKICVKITVAEDVTCSCKPKIVVHCSTDQVWDKRSCKCVCIHKPCTTGTVLDQGSCKCVLKRSLNE